MVPKFRHPSEDLYVVTSYFNPRKFKSRHALYKPFEKHVLDSGAILIVIEATFGDDGREIVQRVGDRHFILHVQVHCEIWLKENLINIAIRIMNDLFPRWEYIAMVDADIIFVRPDWVPKTISLLHKHPIIQMFSHIIQLNANYQPLSGFGFSFMEGYTQGLPVKNKTKSKEGVTRYGWSGAPGGSWAATREFVDNIFPFLDVGILGSGDYHMANGLVGLAETTLSPGYTEGYKNAILDFQDKATRHIGKRKVGYMKGTIIHYWHGSMKDRAYDTRWQLLVKHKFDPDTDLIIDSNGVYSITPDKPGLIRDVANYFNGRREDD